MRLKPIIAIGAALLMGAMLLSGAATAFEKEKFIGKTKTYLLSCAGVPSGTMQSGGAEFLTYEYSRGDGGFDDGYRVRANSCRINFTIRKGKIVDATARSGGGLISGPMTCNSIVENCN